VRLQVQTSVPQKERKRRKERKKGRKGEREKGRETERERERERETERETERKRENEKEGKKEERKKSGHAWCALEGGVGSPVPSALCFLDTIRQTSLPHHFPPPIPPSTFSLPLGTKQHGQAIMEQTLCNSELRLFLLFKLFIEGTFSLQWEANIVEISRPSNKNKCNCVEHREHSTALQQKSR
jgi:hypothetical protein